MNWCHFRAFTGLSSAMLWPSRMPTIRPLLKSLIVVIRRRLLLLKRPLMKRVASLWLKRLLSKMLMLRMSLLNLLRWTTLRNCHLEASATTFWEPLASVHASSLRFSSLYFWAASLEITVRSGGLHCVFIQYHY